MCPFFAQPPSSHFTLPGGLSRLSFIGSAYPTYWLLTHSNKPCTKHQAHACAAGLRKLGFIHTSLTWGWHKTDSVCVCVLVNRINSFYSSISWLPRIFSRPKGNLFCGNQNKENESSLVTRIIAPFLCSFSDGEMIFGTPILPPLAVKMGALEPGTSCEVLHASSCTCAVLFS